MIETSRMAVSKIVDVLLPLFLLALLVALNVQLLLPFVGLLLWTVILAICFNPLHQALKRRGISNRLSATIIGVLLAAVILVPTAIAAISAASSVPQIVAGLQTHHVISEYVGTSREIVTFQMNHLRQKGFLRYSRKGIQVYSDALREHLHRQTKQQVDWSKTTNEGKTLTAGDNPF